MSVIKTTMFTIQFPFILIEFTQNSSFFISTIVLFIVLALAETVLKKPFDVAVSLLN